MSSQAHNKALSLVAVLHCPVNQKYFFYKNK
jgi:hypothetical protein